MIFAGQAVYNLFFHPLRAFPGPVLWRASRIPYAIRSLRGTLTMEMLDVHNKYGMVVRIAPNELAFADPLAWRDIMQTTKGVPEMGKWAEYYRPRANHPGSIFNAPAEEHARLRKQLASGFSERSMRAQAHIFRDYMDLLIRRLRQNCQNGPLDMVDWYNFTTFDLIGDLAFGDSFGCLESSRLHSWLRPICELTRQSSVISTVSHYPWLKKMLLKLMPLVAGNAIANHVAFSEQKLRTRMKVHRPDLIEGLIKGTNNSKEDEASNHLVTTE